MARSRGAASKFRGTAAGSGGSFGSEPSDGTSAVQGLDVLRCDYWSVLNKSWAFSLALAYRLNVSQHVRLVAPSGFEHCRYPQCHDQSRW